MCGPCLSFMLPAFAIKLIRPRHPATDRHLMDVLDQSDRDYWMGCS
jgi:hypothetical protein